jgi:hypothetical protein
MLDHWRDLSGRPGTIVHEPPPEMEEHGLSPFDEQAVNLFLDLCSSSPPTTTGSKPASEDDDDHERHDDDKRHDYDGDASAKRRSYWRLRGLMAWVFAKRGRDACLSFLDDDVTSDDDNDDDKRDKLALFSWLGPSLSRWLQEHRFRFSSNAFNAACKHVAHRLPQAWRMLRACMAATTTAATTTTSPTGMTRAQLEHVTMVLISCMHSFIRTHTWWAPCGLCPSITNWWWRCS